MMGQLTSRWRNIAWLRMGHRKMDLILERQTEMREDLTIVKKILTGNGEPSKGLVVRFDRVEQAFLTRKKFTIAMILSGSAGLLSFGGSIILYLMRTV